MKEYCLEQSALTQALQFMLLVREQENDTDLESEKGML